MLMCTRGVTGEKALEIQQIWPTPRHHKRDAVRDGRVSRAEIIEDGEVGVSGETAAGDE
jgi:hypothetical protein